MKTICLTDSPEVIALKSRFPDLCNQQHRWFQNKSAPVEEFYRIREQKIDIALQITALKYL